MYWFYSTSILNWLLYLLFSFAWMCGGYFIVARAFRLRPAERLFSGLAAGFLLLIFLANLFAGLLGALGQSLPTFAALSLHLLFGWLLLAFSSSGLPWPGLFAGPRCLRRMSGFKSAFFLLYSSCFC